VSARSVEAAVFRGPRDVRVERVAYPALEAPTDVVVRISAAGICGSDLWGYRGIEEVEAGQVMGHEWLGVVEEVGSEVRTLRAGDLVVAPFWFADGTCRACRHGLSTLCDNGGPWGFGLEVGGGQAEAIRAPFADATLLKLPPGTDAASGALKRVLALTDVLPTGHHAAICAGVRPGTTALVVGDGPVGLCAVLAARRLGAERVVVAGRHGDRLALAERFGADATVRADADAAEAVLEATGGGADAVLECVGTQEALDLALAAVRGGGGIGYVGMPTLAPTLPVAELFERSVSFRGGFTPAREYMPELLAEALDGSLDAGPIFSHEVDLQHVGEGYRLMHEREAIKVLVLTG
jgi:threonine dehydrogenase-like Zn-dependent dehydrogenase